jgi:organic hydroperoxide reductase OsmC/OhrA
MSTSHPFLLHIERFATPGTAIALLSRDSDSEDRSSEHVEWEGKRMADVFVSHLEWTGAIKGPTYDPSTFSRDLNLSMNAFTLPMSSAPGYRGDPSRANPEQLFVAALSACQALTYLFLAAKNQIAVVGYSDDAEGRLGPVDGRIRMSRVTLRPRIVLETGANEARARELVTKAHENCFIGNSVATPVDIAPTFGFVETPVAAR